MCIIQNRTNVCFERVGGSMDNKQKLIKLIESIDDDRIIVYLLAFIKRRFNI